MVATLPKAPASRLGLSQRLDWPGGAPTLVTTTFVHNTQHVRVLSQVAGWISFETTGLSSTVGGMLIAPNTAGGDYFDVTPGQVMCFSSTTTSSGSLTVTEMS